MDGTYNSTLLFRKNEAEDPPPCTRRKTRQQNSHLCIKRKCEATDPPTLHQEEKRGNRSAHLAPRRKARQPIRPPCTEKKSEAGEPSPCLTRDWPPCIVRKSEAAEPSLRFPFCGYMFQVDLSKYWHEHS